MKHLLFFIMLAFPAYISFGQKNLTETNRTKWFEDARFGMFIHWGLYSAAEGLWQGEPLRNPNNYAEWIQYRNRISKEDYGKLAKRFNWNKINPEDWVLLAKKAGMKYIIITAKHHDGVAIWDSKVSDYNLSRLSGSKRDVIKELADACKKHNMKLGFYYSHWLDWGHPYGWDHNQELTTRVTDDQYNQYWQEKVIPQLRELLTNYGDIALLWFDMWVDHQTTIVKKEQLQQIIDLTHQLQPNCLINSRLGLPANTAGVDFRTMGDNQMGADYLDYAWETPGTIAHSWGYNGQENQWKSTNQLLQSLIGNVSLNGGYTLNIGPRADGSLPFESVRRLEDMGAWLSRNGYSVYGSTGLGLRNGQHDWGQLTTKKRGKGLQEVYLQVYNWPLDGVLRVSGILSKPREVAMNTPSGIRQLKFIQKGPLTHILLPEKQGDPFASTIIVRYAEPLELDKEIVAESTFGGFALKSTNVWENPQEFKLVRTDGYVPNHLVMNKEGSLTWEVYIPEPGSYNVSISFHNDSGKKVNISVGATDQLINTTLQPTGKVVVEPQDSYSKEFVSNNIGAFKFKKEGFYQIVLNLDKADKQSILLNQLWLESNSK